MDQESEGSLVPTKVSNYIYILEAGVSISMILPLHHMTPLRWVLLC